MAQSNKNSDKVRQFKKSYLDFNFIEVIKKHTNRFTIKIAICVLVAIVAVIGIFLYKRYSSYDGYKVINSIKIDGSTESKYLSYKDFVIKYSGDGISYIDDDGTVWNEAFQMKSPMVDICGDYIAVADKNSNDVYIYNQDGNQGKVTTNFPIVKVEVAEQGVIAVLSEDKDANYIEVYDRDGNKLVIHKTLLDENGYPLDFSISKDGDKMAVSYITVNNGSMSNRVVFYNFSNAGKNSTDKIAGEFDQYKEVIVPTVKFVTNDDVVAAGENILSLYGFKNKPSLREDVKINEEIQKIFYSDQYVGVILKNTNSKFPYRIQVYDLNGNKKMEKEIKLEYDNVSFSGDNVLMYDDMNCQIISFDGVQKFKVTFNGAVNAISPIFVWCFVVMILYGFAFREKISQAKMYW